MSKMLDFEAVIHEFGNRAIEDYRGWMAQDEKALNALAISDVEGIGGWLHYYRVFQGLTSKERNCISGAIVKWANGRDVDRDLASAQSLDDAHKEVMNECAAALGKDRDLTSLASKALWLCYPQQVPIFDSIAGRALCVLSNLEEGMEPFPDGLSKYGKFAYTWKHFFETYSDSISKLDVTSCPYRVRLFDAILLRVGKL